MKESEKPRVAVKRGRVEKKQLEQEEKKDAAVIPFEVAEDVQHVDAKELVIEDSSFFKCKSLEGTTREDWIREHANPESKFMCFVREDLKSNPDTKHFLREGLFY